MACSLHFEGTKHCQDRVTAGNGDHQVILRGYNNALYQKVSWRIPDTHAFFHGRYGDCYERRKIA